MEPIVVLIIVLAPTAIALGFAWAARKLPFGRFYYF